MSWSPRELGELADTSRRAVRHYQEIGLLDEPPRQANGYQRYGVHHLLRLLRVRRLAALGLSLPQIAQMGDTEVVPVDVLRALDAQLVGKIEQLQQNRDELASMMRSAVPAEVPVDLVSHAAGLPVAERGLMVVLSRVLGPADLTAYVDLLHRYRESAAVMSFDDLDPDVDEATRQDLAAGIAEHLHHLAARHEPTIARVHQAARGRPRGGGLLARRAVHAAIMGLYNGAQLDVLARTKGRLDPRLTIAIRAV